MLGGFVLQVNPVTCSFQVDDFELDELKFCNACYMHLNCYDFMPQIL